MTDTITSKDYFVAIKEMVSGVDKVGEIAAADVVKFLDKKIAQLDAKTEKARERAAEKRAEGDALRAKVLDAVTEAFQTADEITSALGDEEITKSKVVARLTQLCKTGEVIKEQVKVDGGRKLMNYRLA